MLTWFYRKLLVNSEFNHIAAFLSRLQKMDLGWLGRCHLSMQELCKALWRSLSNLFLHAALPPVLKATWGWSSKFWQQNILTVGLLKYTYLATSGKHWNLLAQAKCACCDCHLGEVGSTLHTKANLISLPQKLPEINTGLCCGLFLSALFAARWFAVANLLGSTVCDLSLRCEYLNQNLVRYKDTAVNDYNLSM